MEALKSKNLLATKTAKESENREKRAPEIDIGDTAGGEEPEDDAPEGALARAVDLTEWKKGEPVVQKADGTAIYVMRDVAGALQP
ncbi:hypothetical protein H0H87_000787 [Tephrocybe sp. NHM501043]|nr:hypothetical protein H0H87_006091 [Tephrocybe sp. NHM501043]KAG6839448.1 hypothetical protein H0H87_000787 [Tephrocybe sp. NHM501043]